MDEDQIDRDKIDLWKNHQNLDLANVNLSMGAFLGGLASLLAIITIIIGIVSISPKTVNIVLFALCLLIIVCLGWKVYSPMKDSWNRAKTHWERRDKQICKLYKKIYNGRDIRKELDDDFIN